MSLSTIEIIMSRIDTASTESPIAVFTPSLNDPLGNRLNAVFANTVESKRQMNENNLLVGAYNRLSDKRHARKDLADALFSAKYINDKG